MSDELNISGPSVDLFREKVRKILSDRIVKLELEVVRLRTAAKGTERDSWEWNALGSSKEVLGELKNLFKELGL